MEWIADEAQTAGVEVLPEVHAHHRFHQRLAERGFWTFDFCLPLLVLEAIIGKTSRSLLRWLRICPTRQITMLDCHDGIPVQPDLDDLLDREDSRKIIRILVEERGANLNTLLSPNKGADFDAHQIHCTYYSLRWSGSMNYSAVRV